MRFHGEAVQEEDRDRAPVPVCNFRMTEAGSNWVYLTGTVFDAGSINYIDDLYRTDNNETT